MRVSAGYLKGHEFSSPKMSSIHPMSEKMRLSIFNTLGDISNLNVLDAYSGSGALAIEAISRGAKTAVAVDKNKAAIKTINNNIKNLKLDKNIKVTQANISSWSKLNKNKQFDLIFADPPYNDLKLNQIENLSDHLKEKAIFVLSWPEKDTPKLHNFKLIKSKNYGDANLVFYTKVS